MGRKQRFARVDREAAALICAISASEADHGFVSYEEIAASIGASAKALDLAIEAWAAVAPPRTAGWTRESDAEAEAMLRCGWLPGQVRP